MGFLRKVVRKHWHEQMKQEIKERDEKGQRFYTPWKSYWSAFRKQFVGIIKVKKGEK